ncbi:MAG: hypothetical protein KDD01_04060, partial [Phaeodactylibacter sp.]|nr:hypothetical protein [Phaeodactylibacter sp.]
RAGALLFINAILQKLPLGIIPKASQVDAEPVFGFVDPGEREDLGYAVDICRGNGIIAHGSGMESRVSQWMG